MASTADFTEARDSEWQWHQLGHMQVCTSLQTDNHASTPPLSFLYTRCPSCNPTNSAKALKALELYIQIYTLSYSGYGKQKQKNSATGTYALHTVLKFQAFHNNF